MRSVSILLDSVDKIKSFVYDISRFRTDFDIISGRYCVDAKSIMGIFSLDLSKPLSLEIHCDESDPEYPEIQEVLKKYTA